ncbi:MAG: hypothetical protein K6E93_09630 [Bacteroidales bacterium]|nr:hypothetical protein [Bacteroidales bacterium]
MKKIKSFAWLLLAATTLMFSSCKKEYPYVELTETNYYDVTYRVQPNKRYALAETLLGLSEYDADLAVYLYDGGALYGQDYWLKLPCSFEHMSYLYELGGQELVLVADAGEGHQWSNNFTLRIKVVKILRKPWVQTD